uniref:glycerol kinase n=1 Tax=Timema shepardi TaxID=629360 RepID=A0A7R9FYY6_TIMSH|nr:unnamed protein product [Timema shepardi]
MQPNSLEHATSCGGVLHCVASVWQDMRTSSTVDLLLESVPNKNQNYLKPLCGLPLSPYFSALKIRWLMDHVPEVQEAINRRHCMFGTVDSWLIWECVVLPNSCGFLEAKMSCFMAPVSCISDLGNQVIVSCPKEASDIALGQMTHLWRVNVAQRVKSTHGLLTTVAYQMGPSAAPVYALEGSVGVAGAALGWLRDNINLLQDISETESLAETVGGTGDVYFVPAFSGLYAPYWQQDARGYVQISHTHSSTEFLRLGGAEQTVTREIQEYNYCGHIVSVICYCGRIVSVICYCGRIVSVICYCGRIVSVICYCGRIVGVICYCHHIASVICGITEDTTQLHIIRAALEAVCFQTRDILEAMNKDCGIPLSKLQVDGGMTTNNLLMQLQADLIGISVSEYSLHPFNSILLRYYDCFYTHLTELVR